jgi:tryptophan synthase alpha chain
MERIEQAFGALGPDELALVAYLTAGYPNLDESVALVQAAAEAGADIIELGVPFSDPIGDGPIIQAASQLALRAGASTAGTLDVVAKVRAAGLQVPIVLMGYCNPFLRYGLERLYTDAKGAGVDGFVVPDLPPHEADAWVEQAELNDLGQVFFASPASTAERLRLTSNRSRGFLYCLAANGVTGAREQLADGLADYLERVRATARTPVAVGFGISRPEHFATLRGKAEGVIVGSALLSRIALQHTPAERVTATANFISTLKSACR